MDCLKGSGLQVAEMRLERGSDRLRAEALRIEAIKARATPPAEMAAAPVAPARGVQALVANYTVTAGGMRRLEGAHFQALSPLAAFVAQAGLRHSARGSEGDFVPPYSPGQVAMAEMYAALIEWRSGSGLRCASLEGGTAQAGSGHFIDTFMDRGQALAALQARIGAGVALSPRRHMDRGNARRTITARAVVDMVCLSGVDLSEVLRRFGWQADGRNRRELRAALCAALDRMQGYAA